MIKNDRYRNYNDILNADPIELFMWIQTNFIEEIPVVIETTEELAAAGKRLGELTNLYSYFTSMTQFAANQVKHLKSIKAEKIEIDTMMSIRDTLSNATETLNFQYKSISRMISVKKQVADELRMMP